MKDRLIEIYTSSGINTEDSINKINHKLDIMTKKKKNHQ